MSAIKDRLTYRNATGPILLTSEIELKVHSSGLATFTTAPMITTGSNAAIMIGTAMATRTSKENSGDHQRCNGPRSSAGSHGALAAARWDAAVRWGTGS